jgi:hypothetical protein
MLEVEYDDRRWIMTKRILLGLLAAFLLLPCLGAQENQEGKVQQALASHKLGLIFNLGAPLITVGDYADNVQGGLGLKLWLKEKLALRGLLDVTYVNDSELDTSDFFLGVGACLEYHFLPRKVSPYAGLLGGTRIQTGTDNDLDLYAGGVVGAELFILDYLSFYAEYSLLVSINEPVFSIDLGMGNASQVGVIIYLQ